MKPIPRPESPKAFFGADEKPQPEDFALYDEVTGEIEQSGHMMIEGFTPPAGKACFKGKARASDNFIDLADMSVGQKTPSPAVLAAGVASMSSVITVTDIPPGSSVRVTNMEDPVAVDDGILEITPGSVGEVEFTIKHARHYDINFLVEVTE